MTLSLSGPVRLFLSLRWLLPSLLCEGLIFVEGVDQRHVHLAGYCMHRLRPPPPEGNRERQQPL